MNKPIKITDDLAIEVQAAQDKLQRLQQEADEAEAEASRWALTFEREPSEHAFAQKAITEQRAKNARSEALLFQRQDLNDALGRQQAAKQATIKQVLTEQKDAAVERLNSAVELIVQGIREIDGAVVDFARLRHASNEAGKHGVSMLVSLEGLIDQLNGRLGEFRGQQAEIHHTHAHLAVARPYSDAVITLAVTRRVPSHIV